MSDDFNVLSRLVRNENTTTETLCGLLQFKAIRDIFFKLFPGWSLDSDSPADWNVDTQHDIGEHGIPDLVIRGPGVIILVEVKISTGTVPTGNQPKGYLEWLSDQKEGDQRYFVLLAPKKYEYAKQFQVAFAHAPDVKSTIICWEGFIAQLEEHDMQGLNGYVSDFLDILRGWLTPPSLKMDIKEVEAMFGPHAVQGLEKLISIVDRVIDGLRRRNISVAESKNKRWWENNGEYGCYITDGKSTMLWFGVWSKYWKEKGIPLCYGVEIDQPEWLCASVVQNTGKSHSFTATNKKQWHLIDISKETFGEAAPAEKIVEELCGLIDKSKKR